MPASTLSTIIKNKDDIIKILNENLRTRKKMNVGEHPDIKSYLVSAMSLQ